MSKMNKEIMRERRGRGRRGGKVGEGRDGKEEGGEGEGEGAFIIFLGNALPYCHLCK